MLNRRRVVATIWALTIGAVLSLTLALLTAPAYPHQAPTGWSYDAPCCSGTDCHPIPETDVQLQPDGSYMVLATREIFMPPGRPTVLPIRNWRWSKDQSFHRCNPPTGGGYSYCLYVPQPSI
jgi:hypothetical protein